MRNLAFVDIETTGLDPDLHEVWEVALAVYNEDGDFFRDLWYLPVDLGRADPMALKVNRYYEREHEITFSSKGGFAHQFAKATLGKHLVGAAVSFDAERLWKLLKANGQCPMWHYHLVDIEALIAGKLGLQPPWKSSELSEKIGVNKSLFAEHTAMGDVDWAIACYKAVFDFT